MAVKVPPLLHKMSKAAQKAWYKKNNMEMPSSKEGKSAAKAKKVAVIKKTAATIKPKSTREINAERQKAYYAKGGRAPIGAGGSGGSNAMAGVGMSNIKQIKAAIKAGVNPKVAESVVNEATKAEAEKMLGGTVKEKPKMPPGKQPAGYRYVRNLARKAMKKGMGTLPEASSPAQQAAIAIAMKKAGKKPKNEEVAVDEAKKPDASVAMTNQLRMKSISDKDKQTLGKVADLIAAQKKQDKKPMKEESEMQYIEEKLSPDDPASKWISDFVRSDNPKFAGKSKKERIQQALGAYYAAKRGKNEEFEIEESKKMDKMEKEAEAEDDMEDDDEEEMDEAYVGFKKLKAKIAAKGGVRNPAAVAASIGRKKYGKEKFQAMAAAGKKMSEEVEQTDEAVRIVDIEKKGKLPKKQDVRDRLALAAKERRKITGGSGVKGFNKPLGFSPTKYMDTSYVRAIKKEEVVAEAEGKVAVTPKVTAAVTKKGSYSEAVEGKTPETSTEVALAKKHGDPKKITYGDVIKARIEASKKKALNKGE